MAKRFEVLVHEYHTLVISLIKRYYGGRFREQADDISQEIWAKLWESFKKNENNIVNFKSYLYRTVQTTLWDTARALEKDPGQLDDEAEPGETPNTEQAHQRMALEDLLSRLDEEESRMIRAHLQGFNNAEIGMLLGCSEGRVRNLLTRIKKKLVLWGGK
ncbi:MAG: sigma-70 family RNA polymerase sigma factor [Acidobacteriota bacterium]|nr:sigma-70 family RNA polymerase sigma factor [Acidobacteriota bacterium]